MRLGRWELPMAAMASSGALVALLGARWLGASVPAPVVAICAAMAAPIAFAGGVQRLVYVWRGPPVVSFEHMDAVRCRGADADAIRAAAQLRGTLGGAGHVYRRRLALHAAACFVAAGLGALALSSPWEVGGWPLAAVVGLGIAATLLPARPFYYREAMHGEVLVSPPLARGLLAGPRTIPDERGAASASGMGSSLSTYPGDAGRGISPNPAPAAPKLAGAAAHEKR